MAATGNEFVSLKQLKQLADSGKFDGQDGADGKDGVSPNISIGTVSTGAAGSNASASISGSSPNYKLNLTIPRGNTGATGSQGPQGPTGSVSALSAWPVGSIYISYNSTSPASRFGGSWTAINNDRYLRFGGSWSTGGSSGITAGHSHSIPIYLNSSGNIEYIDQGGKNYYGNTTERVSGYTRNVFNRSSYTNLNGVSQAVARTKSETMILDNDPMYQDVYAWRRTS